ncbi:hypothetical protein CRG98_034823 [Punica granatum]|uniref:Uncharacterized protein n=1 Tax=Punica granatum TaxID=22663 RepID=A0A2I0ILI6_PUNGR|nr:hypothetical protein CRG98_034823 [Punica granatum]
MADKGAPNPFNQGGSWSVGIPPIEGVGGSLGLKSYHRPLIPQLGLSALHEQSGDPNRGVGGWQSNPQPLQFKGLGRLESNKFRGPGAPQLTVDPLIGVTGLRLLSITAIEFSAPKPCGHLMGALVPQGWVREPRANSTLGSTSPTRLENHNFVGLWQL